jgi:TATA-box binding protein (TBP) (component of TFIID and TFIIIB)
MEVLKPKVNNVKVSFHLDVSEHTSLLEKIAYKITNSYILIKNIYTFNIFKKSNIVNITGIPSFEHISTAIAKFQSLLSIPPIYTEINVDNTTANGQFPQRLPFQALTNISDCSVRYNPSLFPGAFLTLQNKRKVILFKSGKYIIIGCKSQEEINESFSLLTNIFHCT